MWLDLGFSCLFCDGWCSLPRLVKNLKSVVRLPYFWYSILNQVPVFNFPCLSLDLRQEECHEDSFTVPLLPANHCPHSACLPEPPAECTSRTPLSFLLEQQPSPAPSWLLTHVRTRLLYQGIFLGVGHPVWALTWLCCVLRTADNSPLISRCTLRMWLIWQSVCHTNTWTWVLCSRVHIEKLWNSFYQATATLIPNHTAMQQWKSLHVEHWCKTR